MRILLAVDGSASSQVAMSALAVRDWEPGTRFRVIAVAPPVIPPVGILDAGVSAEALAPVLDEARAWAADSAKRLMAVSGLPVEQAIRCGGAGPQIVEEAQDWGADAVVVGSHGRTGLGRLVMGSVAEYVVRHAPCTVEVIREKRAAVPAEAEPAN